MKRRLAAVFYGGNNPVQTEMAVKFARETSSEDLTTIVIVDQASDPPYHAYDWGREDCDGRTISIRYPQNVGANAMMHRWMTDNWFEEDLPDVIAFFHCDLYIREDGWDQRVLDAFDNNPKLGLIGFVGSNEIDERGGRGGGTMLNYLGDNYGDAGVGSPANHHGLRVHDLRPAAVLDHCSLIFRRTHLETLTPQEGNFAPEHFYDRHLSCETLVKGMHVGVLGISCDHISGGVGGGIYDAATLCREFLDSRGVSYGPQKEREVVYVVSEQDFHRLYLATGFIPLKVEADWSVTHYHRLRGGFWHPRWTPAEGRNMTKRV